MEELEAALSEVINESKLPFEAKRYIVKNIFEKMDLLYNMELLKTQTSKPESEVKTDE